MNEYLKRKTLYCSGLARAFRLSLVLLLAGSVIGLPQSTSGQPRLQIAAEDAVDFEHRVREMNVPDMFGTLKGRIIVPRGQRVDFRQNALWISVGPDHSQRIRDDGTYIFNDLKPGTYKVVLQGNCWLAQRRTVTIRANRTTILNLRSFCSYG